VRIVTPRRPCRSRVTKGYALLAWREADSYELVDAGDSGQAAAAKAAADAAATEWIVPYVQEHYDAQGAGIARGRVEDAYTEAHDGKGRSAARRFVDAQLLLAVAPPGPRVDPRAETLLAKGPGERANGVYLYPACVVPSLLADGANGEEREVGSVAPRNTPARRPPLPNKETGSGGQDELAGGAGSSLPPPVEAER